MPMKYLHTKTEMWKKIVLISYMIFNYIGVVIVVALAWIKAIMETTNSISYCVNLIEFTIDIILISLCYIAVIIGDKFNALELKLKKITHAIKDPDETNAELLCLILYFLVFFYMTGAYAAIGVLFFDSFVPYLLFIAKNHSFLLVSTCIARITIIILKISKQFISIDYLFKKLEHQHLLYNEFKFLTKRNSYDYRLEMFETFAVTFLKLCDLVQEINESFGLLLAFDTALTVFHIFIQIIKILRINSESGFDSGCVLITVYVFILALRYVTLVIACKEIEIQVSI